MAPPLFTAAYGETPIDGDARGYLTPAHAHLHTNAELNRAEAGNIASGWMWAEQQSWTLSDLLTQRAYRDLHARMFGSVWTWAGQYRTREVNIGNCPPEDISMRIEQVMGNLAYQAEAGRDPRELCADFHFSTVQIHPFVNGNGRHSRAVTEILSKSMGLPADSITWSAGRILEAEAHREAYLVAIRKAERGDQRPLVGFMFG